MDDCLVGVEGRQSAGKWPDLVPESEEMRGGQQRKSDRGGDPDYCEEPKRRVIRHT